MSDQEDVLELKDILLVSKVITSLTNLIVENMNELKLFCAW